jgi:hypothetical protein
VFSDTLSLSDWLTACTIGGVWALLSLLAIWAALSQRHWALRGAILILAIAALLHVTAYEVVVFFSLHFALIVPVIYIMKRRRWFESERHDTELSDCTRLFQFAIRDVLWLVTLSACWIAVLCVAVKNCLPFEFVPFACNLALGAGFSIVATVVLLAHQRFIPTKLLWTIALALHMVGFWFSTTKLDWLYLEILIFSSSRAHYFYLVSAGMQICEILLVLALARITSWPSPRVNAGGVLRGKLYATRLARVIVGVIAVAVLLPLSWLYVKMAFPPQPPLPIADRPPSRFSELVAIGGTLDNPLESEANNDLAAFEKFVADQKTNLAKAHRLLDEPLYNDVVYGRVRPSELNLITGLTELRKTARAFVAEGVWHETNGDSDRAIDGYVDAIRLGRIHARDKLVVDYLVGHAIEGIGLQALIEGRHKLNRSQCERLLQIAARNTAAVSGLEAAYDREYVWALHVTGWFGRLQSILTMQTGDFCEFKPSLTDLETERRAAYGMLMVDAALRAYRYDHGQLPQRLEELTLDYFDAMPLDPFSGQPFEFRRNSADEFTLYSVGVNRVDDGGVVFGDDPTKSYRIPDQIESLRAQETGVNREQGDLFLDRSSWYDPINPFADDVMSE